MKSITKEQIVELEVKKSRFICHIKNVQNEDEAKRYVLALKQIHPSASHHCYAYRVGSVERANDDGEPSQTAGMPILNVLKHNQMVDTIAVVVRYFGGVKLGAGGLVRAYTESVVNCLSAATIADLIAGYRVEIKAGYSDIDKVNYILAQANVTEIAIGYEQKVTFEFDVQQDVFEDVSNRILAFNHQIKIKIKNEVTVVQNRPK